MCARKSDVMALKEAAMELMAAHGHQQELRVIIEPQLIQLNYRWGDILHRIHVSNRVLYVNKVSVNKSVGGST
jgi:hypothetical protein